MLCSDTPSVSKSRRFSATIDDISRIFDKNHCDGGSYKYVLKWYTVPHWA